MLVGDDLPEREEGAWGVSQAFQTEGEGWGGEEASSKESEKNDISITKSSAARLNASKGEQARMQWIGLVGDKTIECC